jgi:hypothetical protein
MFGTTNCPNALAKWMPDRGRLNLLADSARVVSSLCNVGCAAKKKSRSPGIAKFCRARRDRGFITLVRGDARSVRSGQVFGLARVASLFGARVALHSA